MTADLSPTAGVARVPGTGPPPRVRISGPGALVACLDQLIGFPPVESLVVIGMTGLPDGRHEIAMTMRVDLSAVVAALDHRADEVELLCERLGDDPEDEEIEDRLDRLVLERAAFPSHPASMVAVLMRNGCTHAQLVAVSDEATAPRRIDGLDALVEGGDGAARAVDEMGLTLELAGLGVVDALLVRQGRWWSYLCTREECCPPEGTQIAAADADLLRAERVWAGDPDRSVASRADIVVRVAAAEDADSAAVAEILREGAVRDEDPSDAVGFAAALLDRFRSGQVSVAAEEWARLLLALTDVIVRDACAATWRGPAGQAALDLWCAATRVAPPGYVAAPATLAGVVAHARGEGALAGEALERALHDDPGYRMAGYAMTALSAGIPPRSVRQIIVGAAGTLRARGVPVLDGDGRVSTGHERRHRTRRSASRS